jgi:Nickel/cobalt transporter regulator
MMRMAERRLSYQRPSYGFQLPPQWMTSESYVDYREFGLDRPAPGFGWSRYYNDMVLTDQWGRVYDVADPYDRDDRRRGDHDHGRRFGSRDTDGIAGGLAGAAVGAVAGNVIAGAGSRLAGSLIGGGVGALAGLAVEAALSKHNKRERHHDDRWGSDDSGYRRGHAHWGGNWGGGYPAASWSYGNCNCGGETVTTTTTTHGGGYMVPRQVVSYENVYAPAPTKYRVRAAAPKPTGKIRERTKLHTKTY